MRNGIYSNLRFLQDMRTCNSRTQRFNTIKWEDKGFGILQKKTEELSFPLGIKIVTLTNLKPLLNDDVSTDSDFKK